MAAASRTVKREKKEKKKGEGMTEKKDAWEGGRMPEEERATATSFPSFLPHLLSLSPQASFPFRPY